MAIPRKAPPTQPETAVKAAIPADPKVNLPLATGVPPSVAGVKDTSTDISPDPTPATPAQQPTMSAPPAQPKPAVMVPTMTYNPAPVSDEDLPSILRRLNPIQRQKLRSAAISEGLIQSPTGARENSDGSLSVTITIDPDLVPQLRTWAEEAAVPIDQQVREIVSMLLNSYLLSPWEPPQPVGAPTPAPVAAGGEPAAAK